jgi:hypothetical protein
MDGTQLMYVPSIAPTALLKNGENLMLLDILARRE